MQNRFNVIKKTLLIGFLTLGICNPSFANDEITNKLLQRIEKSKQALNRTQSNINKQSMSLNSRLSKQLTEVEFLRSNAASLQRLADEQLISYESLKNRVDLWSTQKAPTLISIS